MEGHYIRGYGDRSKNAQIYLINNANQQAFDFLNSDTDALKTLEKVKKLISGFETPYGMELLASVHWAVNEHPELSSDPDKIVKFVHNWNQRKKKLFSEDHIKVAVEHIKIYC